MEESGIVIRPLDKLYKCTYTHYPINSDMKDDAAITNLFSQFAILNPAISDSGTHRKNCLALM